MLPLLYNQYQRMSEIFRRFWVLGAVVPRCSVKKVFLEISQISQKNISARISFLITFSPEAFNFIKNETPVEVFSCECWEMSKNTFFTGHYRWLLLELFCSNRNNSSKVVSWVTAVTVSKCSNKNSNTLFFRIPQNNCFREVIFLQEPLTS